MDELDIIDVEDVISVDSSFTDDVSVDELFTEDVNVEDVIEDVVETEINVVEELIVDDNVYVSDDIVDDLPNVVGAGQFYIYVPVASANNKGIAEFNNEHFTVIDGIVYIKFAPKAKADKNGEDIADTYQRKDNMINRWITNLLDSQYPSAKLVKSTLDKINYDKGKAIFVFNTKEDFINWLDGKLETDINGKIITDLAVGDDVFVLDLPANYWCKKLSNPLTVDDFVSYADLSILDGLKSEWGNIEGDINNQTDLISLLENSIPKTGKDIKLVEDNDTSVTDAIINTNVIVDEVVKKIPNQASETNQLADKDFVNSSIETATATFRGTYKNLDELKLTIGDKNDYTFYDHYVEGNRTFDRYKYNGKEWVYEYSLNNSSFTDAQWKAINSGITAELKNQILTNTDSINNLLNTVTELNTNKANQASLNETNQTVSIMKTKLDGIEAGAEVNTVDSVNGKTGEVQLTAEDVGALPSDTSLFSGDYNDLTNKPTIPTNNNQLINGAGYITSSGTSANATKLNGQEASYYLNYNNLSNKPSIPTTASEVNALPDTTKYGASIDLSINNTTYVVTAQLKDQNGNNLGDAKTIDLPLESVVVSGSYDATNKKVILTLKDGSTIDFSVADLVSGLQKEITLTNKLSVNLIDGLSTVAKTGSYNDLSDKPNIPTDYLPLSGGEMTGAVMITADSKLKIDNLNKRAILSSPLYNFGKFYVIGHRMTGNMYETQYHPNIYIDNDGELHIDNKNVYANGFYIGSKRVLVQGDVDDKADKSELGSYIKYSAISNDLTDNSTSKVASAYSANKLRTLINNLSSNFSEVQKQYVKNATIEDDVLTITKHDDYGDSTITFKGGGGSKLYWREWT
jgi:hypothetical protein